MELTPASVTVLSYFPGDDGRWPRCGCSTRAPAGPVADPLGHSDLGDDHVEPRARASARAASTFQPRSRSRSASAPGSRWLAPSSSRARTIRPLVALLKWLHHLAPAVAARAAPARVATRGARSGAGRQNAAYVAGAQVHQQPAADGLARRPRRGAARHSAGDRAEAGQGGVAGEPVRRDPVAGPDQAEQRRGDREPARPRVAWRRRPRRGEVEGVVQHPGVDLVGAGRRGGRAAPALRATRSAGWARARAPAAALRVAARRGRPARRATRSRASVRPGKTSVAEVERARRARGAVLPSLGGSRISTRVSLGPRSAGRG